LFLDDRLRDRPAEIRGRRYAGVPYLQVLSFKVKREGRLETPEYFCEVCAISVRYPQVCPCCQGPMELRMKPDRR
jgi:rubrerythrin